MEVVINKILRICVFVFPFWLCSQQTQPQQKIDGVAAVVGDRVVFITGSFGAYSSHRLINHKIVAKIPDELDDATMATNFSRALTVNMLTEQVFNLKDKKIILVTAAAGGVGRLLCQYLNSQKEYLAL